MYSPAIDHAIMHRATSSSFYDIGVCKYTLFHTDILLLRCQAQSSQSLTDYQIRPQDLFHRIVIYLPVVQSGVSHSRLSFHHLCNAMTGCSLVSAQQSQGVTERPDMGNKDGRLDGVQVDERVEEDRVGDVPQWLSDQHLAWDAGR